MTFCERSSATGGHKVQLCAGGDWRLALSQGLGGCRMLAMGSQASRFDKNMHSPCELARVSATMRPRRGGRGADNLLHRRRFRRHQSLRLRLASGWGSRPTGPVCSHRQLHWRRKRERRGPQRRISRCCRRALCGSIWDPILLPATPRACRGSTPTDEYTVDNVRTVIPTPMLGFIVCNRP